MKRIEHPLAAYLSRAALLGALLAPMSLAPSLAIAAERTGEASHGDHAGGADHDEDDDHGKGPNGGEVTQAGGMEIESLLSEAGGKPRLKLWAMLDEKPLASGNLKATGTLLRPNGERVRITFSNVDGTLQSDQVIAEPHYFSLEIDVIAARENKQAKITVVRREGLIELNDEQIKTAGLKLDTAGPSTLQTTLPFPGEIKFNEDRTAHVVPRLNGIVESVPAALGQQVKAGEVLAVIASTALADLRSEYMAAQRRAALASTVYKRERTLWQEKVSAEQDFLQARAAMEEAHITLQNAKQKLAAIGADSSPTQQLGRLELRAPFDGMVIQKHITLGESITEATTVFTLSDLRTVWVEFQIAAKDLESVQVGKKVEVSSAAFSGKAAGTIAYVGALVGQQTRTATARISLENPNMAWRPGIFVTVAVVVSETNSGITVSSDAIQTVENSPVVFIAVPDGFVAQPVILGKSTNNRVEIIGGLTPGVKYVAANSFILKSELGKASAEHAH